MVSIPGSDGAIGELSSLSQPVTGSNPAADFILALFPRGIACYRSTRSLWRTMCLYGAYIKAVHHFKTALGITPSHNHVLPLIHYQLWELYLLEYRLYDAKAHFECVKSHVADNVWRMMRLRVWFLLEGVGSEVLDPLDSGDLECYSRLSRQTKEMGGPAVLYFDGKLLKTTLLPTPTDSPRAAY
jgi:hypothetical protein